MKVLVTGATGFIGSCLTAALLKKSRRVRALVMPGEDAGALEKRGVEIRRGDLTKPGTLRGLCDGVNTVFHLAARVTDWGKRKDFYDAILAGTKNVIEEAAGRASRFVYISSIAAAGLGRHLRGFRETDEPRKSGMPYNDAKLDAERLVMGFHNAGEIACTIVRPANVTGPGSVWVRDIVEKMLIMPVPLFDGGRYSASLVFVENLVDGILLAGAKKTAEGKIYHLRDDWDVSWKRYVTDLGSFIGKKPAGNLPYMVAWPMARLLDGLLTPLGIRPPVTRMAVAIMGRDLDVDSSLAREELGWKTKVSYENAMVKIGAWVKEVYSKQ